MNSAGEESPNWIDHIRKLPVNPSGERGLGIIPDNVYLVRGDDDEIYLARPYELLTTEQQDLYDDYAEENGPAQILPTNMDIKEFFLASNSLHYGLQSYVQGSVHTLSQGVEFVDNLNANFEILKKYYGIKADEEIKKLLTKFFISIIRDTNESGGNSEVVHRIEEEVREGKYKTALFLYWLSGDYDVFIMDDIRRSLVSKYFGSAICFHLDAHPSVQLLLQEPSQDRTEISINLKKIRQA